MCLGVLDTFQTDFRATPKSTGLFHRVLTISSFANCAGKMRVQDCMKSSALMTTASEIL